MTLIDQRIVIDAPPHVVWNHISDPNEVRRWHSGYRNISVLTTQQTGMGTRRRCMPADGGKDVIEEITAWVEGLGYEYTQVEGGSHSSMRARIRLQAGPDGTIVQWTVTYKPRGLVGALRDMLGGKREMQAMMSESLRMLRRHIDELGLRMDAEYRERVSMRGRLNHDERQEYLTRHGGQSPQAMSSGQGVAAAAPEFAEPGPVQGPVTAAVSTTATQDAVPPVTEPATVTPPEPVAPPVAEPAPAAPPVAEAFEAAPADALDHSEAVPSFVNDLLRDVEGVEPAGAADYSHTADTSPKPPEGLHEALSGEPAPKSAGQDAEADVKRATEELIHPTALPSAQEPLSGERSLPTGPPVPPVPPRQTPDVAPAYSSKAPTRPLDPEKGKLVDVPGKPDIPPQDTSTGADAGDAHSRPTPPRGIPSVRKLATMEPVHVDADDSAPQTVSEPASAPTPAAKPLSPSAPTPARGIPAVRPAFEKTDTGERERAAHLPPPTPKTDTGEMSIWEVFGTQRPSEQDESALQDLIESVTAKEVAENRRRSRWARRPARVRYVQVAVGLRSRMRLQHARVRVHRVRRSPHEE